MNRHETLGLNEQPTSSPDIYTYEHFAEQPEYRKVNRELVKLIVPYLPDNFFHVDVATGTGLVPQLLIEEVGKHKGEIMGIDPNNVSLAIARATTHGTENILVKFIEGKGQYLKTLLHGEIPEEGVDYVSIHDALHEIRDEDDKIKTVKGMADILKKGGVFSFNSAFTTDTIKRDPLAWAGWKLRAMKILEVKRDKQAKTIPIYTPDKYKEMIQNAGLRIIHEAQKEVKLSKKALQAISMYPAFINGLFEDMIGHENVSLEDKSRSLIQALDDQNIIGLTRIWYEVIAQKPVS